MMSYALAPRRRWVWATAATVAVVFFLATHDLLSALQWRETLPEEVRALVREVSQGRMRRQFAFPILALAGGMALLARSPRRGRWDPLLAILLGSFLAWQFVSIAWAADPLLTGKRLLVLAMMVIGAAGLVRQLSADGLLRVVAICTLAHLLVGVTTELWLGTFAPFAPGYRFAGTLHPNQQAINCALLALSSIYLARVAEGSRARGAALTVLTLAIGFLLLTRSRTAVVAGGLAVLLFILLEAPAIRRLAIGAGAAAGVTLLLLLQANGMISSAGRLILLGRDESSFGTFTGRTEIWSYAVRHATERPLLGHGYNSFWSPRHTEEVSHFVDWKISEGHSAYLDTLLNLGAIGLLLFLGVLAAGVFVAIRVHRVADEPSMAAAAALLIFAMLDGLLESAVVIPNLLSFVTLAMLAAIAWRGEAHPSPVARRLGLPARPALANR